MLRKLIAYLYFRYCPQPPQSKPDIIAMTREQLNLIGPFSEVDDEDKKGLYLEARDVLKGNVFKYIIRKLTNEQSDHTVRYAASWDNALAGRLNINGFSLVLEEMEALASQCPQEEEAKEPYSTL